MKIKLLLIGFSILGWIFLKGWLSPAFAATKILAGKHTIIYDIVNPLGVEFLPDYGDSSG